MRTISAIYESQNQPGNINFYSSSFNAAVGQSRQLANVSLMIFTFILQDIMSKSLLQKTPDWNAQRYIDLFHFFSIPTQTQ